jgi:hypothetical protein
VVRSGLISLNPNFGVNQRRFFESVTKPDSYLICKMIVKFKIRAALLVELGSNQIKLLSHNRYGGLESILASPVHCLLPADTIGSLLTEQLPELGLVA